MYIYLPLEAFIYSILELSIIYLQNFGLNLLALMALYVSMRRKEAIQSINQSINQSIMDRELGAIQVIDGQITPIKPLGWVLY